MLPRLSALAVDALLCASTNCVQARHRLHNRSRDEMERYVVDCEKLTPQDFYSAPPDENIASAINGKYGSTVTWCSPIETQFPANNTARADLFPSSRGW